MLDNEDILMHYEYKPNNEYYGTSKTEILDKLSQGKFIIDETDEESVLDMINNNKLPKDLFSTIYIAPPSLEEAERRIEKRQHIEALELKKRVENVKERLELYNKTKEYYDLEIINDNLEESSKKLKEFIIAKINKNP